MSSQVGRDSVGKCSRQESFLGPTKTSIDVSYPRRTIKQFESESLVLDEDLRQYQEQMLLTRIM